MGNTPGQKAVPECRPVLYRVSRPHKPGQVGLQVERVPEGDPLHRVTAVMAVKDRFASAVGKLDAQITTMDGEAFLQDESVFSIGVTVPMSVDGFPVVTFSLIHLFGKYVREQQLVLACDGTVDFQKLVAATQEVRLAMAPPPNVEPDYIDVDAAAVEEEEECQPEEEDGPSSAASPTAVPPVAPLGTSRLVPKLPSRNQALNLSRGLNCLRSHAHAIQRKLHVEQDYDNPVAMWSLYTEAIRMVMKCHLIFRMLAIVEEAGGLRPRSREFLAWNTLRLGIALAMTKPATMNFDNVPIFQHITRRLLGEEYTRELMPQMEELCFQTRKRPRTAPDSHVLLPETDDHQRELSRVVMAIVRAHGGFNWTEDVHELLRRLHPSLDEEFQTENKAKGHGTTGSPLT